MKIRDFSHTELRELAALCTGAVLLAGVAVVLSGAATKGSATLTANISPASQTASIISCLVNGCSDGSTGYFKAQSTSVPYGSATTLSWLLTDDQGNYITGCTVSGGLYGSGTSVGNPGSGSSDVINSPVTYNFSCTWNSRGGIITYTFPSVTVSPFAVPILTITGNGQNPVTVAINTPVVVAATFAPESGDTLTETAINDYQNNLWCGTGNTCSQSIWTQAPLGAKSYTFTPSTLGTYVFYPAVQTTDLSSWNNWGQSLIVTVGNACINGEGAVNLCTSCNPGYTLQDGLGAAKQIYLTSGTSWQVPSDWNSSANTIEVIGGGGGGAAGTTGGRTSPGGGGGGGGGAYSEKTNVSLSPGGSVNISIGAGGGSGGTGGDSYFNGASCASSLVCAKGGSAGAGGLSGSGGSGGSSAGGVGSTVYSGGAGAAGAGGSRGGGGGGAGGPHGNGNSASSGTGGSGDAGSGGTSGSGGNANSAGGGLYGGGGAGGFNGSAGGAGGQGIIVITYQPTNDICVAQCPNGQGAPGSCTSCNSGYILSGGSCYPQCPNGQGVAGSCTSCNSGYTLQGGSCVLNNPTPAISTFSATPTRVRVNAATNVTFTWSGTNLGGCSISGTSISNASSPQTASITISGSTIYTLTCGSASAQTTIGLVPTIKEI